MSCDPHQTLRYAATDTGSVSVNESNFSSRLTPSVLHRRSSISKIQSYMMAWMYILVLVTVVLLCMFWLLVVRVYVLRRFYEKQGIVFVKDCYAVIGAELRVSKLREKNRSHDWLYTERSSDLVGTIRGHSVQLY